MTSKLVWSGLPSSNHILLGCGRLQRHVSHDAIHRYAKAVCEPYLGGWLTLLLSSIFVPGVFSQGMPATISCMILSHVLPGVRADAGAQAAVQGRVPG